MSSPAERLLPLLIQGRALRQVAFASPPAGSPSPGNLHSLALRVRARSLSEEEEATAQTARAKRLAQPCHREVIWVEARRQIAAAALAGDVGEVLALAEALESFLCEEGLTSTDPASLLAGSCL
jgi:hypothetical protein